MVYWQRLVPALHLIYWFRLYRMPKSSSAHDTVDLKLLILAVPFLNHPLPHLVPTLVNPQRQCASEIADR